jgi:hypothetical protein
MRAYYDINTGQMEPDFGLPISLEILDWQIEDEYTITVWFTDIEGERRTEEFEMWDVYHEGKDKEYSEMRSESGEYQILMTSENGEITEDCDINEIDYIG